MGRRSPTISWNHVAFENKRFYICALVIIILHGLGGVVHAGNVPDFRKGKWFARPLSLWLGGFVPVHIERDRPGIRLLMEHRRDARATGEPLGCLTAARN